MTGILVPKGGKRSLPFFEAKWGSGGRGSNPLTLMSYREYLLDEEKASLHPATTSY